MTPTHNPVLFLLHAMHSGSNPRALLQQMAAQNSQAAQVMQMMQGKTPQQVEQLARNMAKERGTNIEELARQLGLPFRK